MREMNVPRLMSLPRSALVLPFVLVGCGSVQLQPDASLPPALVVPEPAKVGLVLTRQMQKFTHKENRAGVDYAVRLGPGHAHLWRDAMRAEFREVTEVSDPAALAAAGLQAALEPRIEQYSFATAHETGGAYYAVTIRYRINLYGGDGKLVDTFTLTGYGNALAGGLSSDKPLVAASLAAMRDAAAKFLVQFPEQEVAKTLAQGGTLTADTAKPMTASAGVTPEIEAVPIEDTAADAPTTKPPG
jgi:hypothetical protein